MPQYLQFILVAVVIQACVCAILPNDPRIDVQHRSDIVSKEIGQRFNKGLKRSVTGQKKVMELEPSAEPTTEPTLSEDLPSAEPTLFPTHLASSSAGYYYFTNSFNSDCSDPVASAGEPANKCLTDDDSTSYMIRLEDGKLFFLSSTANIHFLFRVLQFCRQLEHCFHGLFFRPSLPGA